MERYYTNSSIIARVKYIEDKKILEVEYKNGATYQYLEVPDEVANSVLAAESVGSAVTQQIKGTYEYTKVA